MRNPSVFFSARPAHDARGLRRGGRRLVAGAAALMAATAARAEICKYVDNSRADGVALYCNVSPGPGWIGSIAFRATTDPARRAAEGGARPPSPPGFPRVNPETQRGRDDVRREDHGRGARDPRRSCWPTRALPTPTARRFPLPQGKANAKKCRVRIGKLRQALNVPRKRQ